MRWDVHNHAVPIEAVRALGTASQIEIDDDVITADRVRFRLTPEFTDPTAKLAELEKLGLDAAIVSWVPPLFGYQLPKDDGIALCHAVNAGLADFCRAEPDRLRWLAHVPMQAPEEAAQMLTQAVADGAVGIQIGTSLPHAFLDAPELDVFWAAVARLQTTVMLHPAYNGAHLGMEQYYFQNVIGNQLETTIAAERLICAGVLERHEAFRLLLVHGGGYLPWQFGRLRHARRVRQELTGAPADAGTGLDRIFVDTITHDAAVLRCLVELQGADHVVMGTDLPFDMANDEPVTQLQSAVEADVASEIMERTSPSLFDVAQQTSRVPQ